MFGGVDTLKTTLTDVQTKVNAVEGSVNEFDIRTRNMKTSTLENLKTPSIKRADFRKYITNNSEEDDFPTWESQDRPTGINDKNIVYVELINITGECLVQYLELYLKALKSSNGLLVQPFIRVTFGKTQFIYSTTLSLETKIGFISGQSFLNKDNFYKFPDSQCFSSSNEIVITPLQGPLYCQNGFKIEYGLWHAKGYSVRDGGVKCSVEYFLT